MKASLEGLMPDGLSRLAHCHLAVCEREKGLDADAARHFAAAGLVPQWIAKPGHRRWSSRPVSAIRTSWCRLWC